MEQDLGEVQSVVIYVVVVQFYGSQLLFALVYNVRRSHDFWVCRNLVKQGDLAQQGNCLLGEVPTALAETLLVPWVTQM